ncbi:NUDIX hydrolase [Bacillus ndiopicus]|uniref:NUDIX hydrolase n=1 Tax=Bacillus ndiopicus TaxID=1347368 RepID=UPI0005AA3963|nr:NUDIX domain-containing protein [Bacillus ndiopicus]
MRSIYENWGDSVVKLTWIPKMNLDDIRAKITSVHSVCVQNNKILLSLIDKRGFSIPGGHIDEGESVEDAMHREALEEAYVKGEITYLGCIEVSHEENPNFNPNGKYPKIGYQAFFRMDIHECLPFAREYESKTRIWVEPSEIIYVIDDHELIIDIVREAFRSMYKNERHELNEL